MKLAKIFDKTDLVTAIVAAIVIGVWGWATDRLTWSYVSNFVIEATRFLAASIAVDRWVAWGCALYAFLLTGFILAAVLQNFKQVAERGYTEDVFHNLLWQWYVSGGEVRNLHACCPHCKLQLVWNEVHEMNNLKVQFECDDGHGRWEFPKSYRELEFEIVRRIHQRTRLARDQGITPSELADRMGG